MKLPGPETDVDWTIDLRDPAVVEVQLEPIARNLSIEQIEPCHLTDQQRFERSLTVVLTTGTRTRYIKERGERTSR